MQARKGNTIREVHAKDFLVPDRKSSPRHDSASSADIEDAVFEVVRPKDKSRTRLNDNIRSTNEKPDAATKSLIQLFRAAILLACTAEGFLKRLSPQGFMLLLSALAITAFWALGGFTALVAAQRAPAAGEDGFAIVRLSIVAEDANGMRLARISGELLNRLDRTARAPRLKIVTDHGRTVIGSIELPVEEIGPESRLGFLGRFNLAGGKTADIEVVPEVR